MAANKKKSWSEQVFLFGGMLFGLCTLIFAALVFVQVLLYGGPNFKVAAGLATVIGVPSAVYQRVKGPREDA
ncbi:MULTISPECIES: hypothetical protein [Pseudovibrio]|uniref:hypothetical protein n=1 Tax=Stappiaceae TaxID=2821832 RepID=UPI002366A57C|nr:MULTISPECIES: hypothetical protein [Pseudovibrio]MDD7908979.1 hypothetical protein [Pseudovibrio exalbescens]MDX5593700.1 hypothetical protein [Pseudovibrio sp. SPO723]